MLEKILGVCDIIAAFLVLTANPLGSYYLIFKGIVFLFVSKGSCLLSWTDFLLGLMLVLFFSQSLSFIIFIYLLVKSLLSFV